MISPIAVAILVSTISVVSSFNGSRCKQLPNGCEIKSYYCLIRDISDLETDIESFPSSCYFYVCDKIDLNFKFSEPEMELLKKCYSNEDISSALSHVYFWLSKNSFLDSTFDLFNRNFFFEYPILSTTADSFYYTSFYQKIENIGRIITFRYIKGFDSGIFKPINFSKFSVNFGLIFLQLDFYYSNFDFYLNRSLIRSCDDLDHQNIPKYVFYSISSDFSIFIRFINCEYKTKICPLLFLNMNIYLIEFNGIQNTFYKTNFPRFFPILNSSFKLKFNYHDSRYSIDSWIRSLNFINMKNIELNSVILNENLFFGIDELRLYGDIISIEKGLFKSFKYLKSIELDILSIRKLFHHGIDWVFDLNEDVNVDIHNISSFNDSFICVNIYINSISNDRWTTPSLDFNFIDYFPNEDFCLYAQFPFQQLILMNFYGVELKGKDYSCTYLWFYQHIKIFGNFCTLSFFNMMISSSIYSIPEVDQKKLDNCKFKEK